VTISGHGFTGASAVDFGSGSAIAFTVVSDTQITATTPPESAGTVGVSVSGVGGSATDAGAFTYVIPPPPTITSVNPSSGSTGGGTTVDLSGTNLLYATSITFGGSSGTLVTDSATAISVTTPPGAAGAADVVVNTADGTTTDAGGFTYVAAPTITSVTPSNGPTSCSTVVTITGTGFTGATAVDFGTNPAASFTVDSPTQITAATPAGPAGTFHTTVTTPGGTSATSAADQFTYLSGTPVVSVSPHAGATAGGTVVTITGACFTGATAVDFGANSATSFTVDSATSITATTPAGSAGPVDVTVNDPTGQGTLPLGYTYVAPPTITSINPRSGPTAGGTRVTITGTNLSPALVAFGHTLGKITSDSPTSITVTTPAGTAGAVPVIVGTPGGFAVGGTFTYVAPPTITSVSPDVGPTAGGTAVTITGTNLSPALVGFGHALAKVTADSATSITATTPAGVAGHATVIVATAGGFAVKVGGFTYS